MGGIGLASVLVGNRCDGRYPSLEGCRLRIDSGEVSD
jgi:hypothetical protein